MAKSEIRNKPNLVRISPRITKKLSILAKYVYSIKGVTLEDRVTYLIQKDIEELTKQKWYKEHLKEVDKEENSLNYLMKYMVSGLRDKDEVPLVDPLLDEEE